MKAKEFTEVVNRLVDEFVEKVHKREFKNCDFTPESFPSLDNVTRDDVELDFGAFGITFSIDNVVNVYGNITMCVSCFVAVASDKHIGKIEVVY